MITFWIILSVLLIFLILFRIMMNGFRNPERKHEKTPLDEGITFEEVQFKTKNNKRLYGWWIFNDANYPTIVLVHGWGRNVERMIPYLVELNQQHYNLLVFDSRNHGSSDMDKTSTMKKFAEDISASIDYVLCTAELINTKIGVLGLSIGGAAAIYASAYDDRIESVVTVGAFANPMDVMKLQLSKRNIPFYPVGWMLLSYLQLILGLKFNDIAPENTIEKVTANLLLIHGTDDVTIPLSHAERLLKRSQNGKAELWVIPAKGHSDCHLETGFWNKIILFFNKTLN